MAGSDAEERIRAKAVTLLRQWWPAARVIHELQLEQGGVRIDLAAVEPDWLTVVEIKSELDVLKRLPRQVRQSRVVADEVWIVVAAKHEEAVEEMRRADWGSFGRSRLLVEPDPESPLRWAKWDAKTGRKRMRADPWQRFELLWAEEMRSALGRHFGGATLPGSSRQMHRGKMTEVAVEFMTGQELRRAVYEQLRERQFPRADAPTGQKEAAHVEVQAKLV